MQNFVILILLEILGVIQASKPRSVNVALETVLEFDNEDDVEFIDTIRNFLKKLKTTITRNRAVNDRGINLENYNEDPNKKFIFTDFLAETIKVLKSYTDEDLKHFFNILDRQIKTWQTRKEFQEITDKLGFRRLIDRNLQNFKNSSVAEKRRKLNTFSDKLNFDNRNRNNGFVADFLNYFYKKESETNLLNFLNNLKLYRSGTRRNNVTDLRRIIRNGILTIIDPLLKLNSSAIRNINRIYYKFITNSSNTIHAKDFLKNNQVKSRISRQKHKLHNVLKENEILDYIESYKRVIDNHLSTDFVTKAKVKSIPRKFETTGTTYKHIHTTSSRKNRNIKTKQGNLGKNTIKPRDKKNHKNEIFEIIKNSGAINSTRDRKPVLIQLTSNGNSPLKSVEEYLSSTTKRQKRHKKSTTRKLTPNKPNVYLKTTKKFRKAFRTTTLSAEGLSIEHFGSLFGRDYHRKSNDDDTFVQTILNTSTAALPKDATFTKDRSDGISDEMRMNNNLSKENEEYNIEKHDGNKNLSPSIEENIENIETLDETHNGITESIKIKGNIIIEQPTEATTLNEKDINTLNPEYNFTTHRNFNVSIVTRYFNIKPMKPTIMLRSQHRETSNETNVNTTETSTILQTTSYIIPAAQTTYFSANETEIDNINIKTTEDGLENEIEDIMDKSNATIIPLEFENLIKETQINNNENKQVKEQLQADLTKLLPLPNTKNTVNVLFTDGFEDVDDAADIL